MDQALARAESLWQSGEAARLVAAEKRWKEQSRAAMEQASVTLNARKQRRPRSCMLRMEP